jgi:hypothetical protein
MGNYNLITGKLQNLQSTPLTPDENAAYNQWYQSLVLQKGEIDPEIAASFEKQKDFYAFAASVAKSYFAVNNIPFVPQEPTSGTFGVREILPVDLGANAIVWGATPVTATIHSWVQALTVAAANGWTNLFGTLAAPITPSNTQSYHSLLAFHSLISWQPGTRITALKHSVNSYTYPEVSVEQSAKIDKPFKTFKLIPLEGDFLIHPTGTFSTRLELEKNVFANAETYSEQIGILGLVFAEYAYLNAEIN